MSTAGLEDLPSLDTVLSLQSGETGNVNRRLSGLDAERLRHWCLRHQIGGLTYLLLEDSSLRIEEAGRLAAGLRGAYLEQWARTERLRLSLLALDSRMRELGEEYLVLKGLPFAQRYYGGHDRRATGDLDIWVRRSRAPLVAGALEARGLTRRSPKYADGSAAFDHVHQVELDLDGTGVEVHHALRVHPTFRIDEEALWRDRIAVTIHPDLGAGAGSAAPTLTLSDEHALLLHLLGLHTDVQIGQVQARWFVDLHQLLLAAGGRIDWDGFFAARTADGTRRICVNALAVFLVLTRRNDCFPELSEAVARRRADVVGTPSRAEYLSLLRGDSLLRRKRWPLEQYDGSVVAAIAWWLSGLPHRIAAKPAAFAEDVTATRAIESPWDHILDGRTPPLTAELGIDVDTLQDTTLRFGTLSAVVRAERASDVAALRELFRLRERVTSTSAHAGDADLMLHLVTLGHDARARLRVPVRPVVEHPLERRLEVHEGIVHAWIDENQPLTACLAIDRERETPPLLLHSLMVVMNRLLARQGRYHLHAAAIGVAGATWLFVGGKGSGKSTISLALGRLGATVFSEDHVMLRLDGDRFLVSGCDGDLHLTASTERHFFEEPIEGLLIDRAGVSKKRVDAASIVDCRPYEETPVRGLFFPDVGDRFDIAPLARGEALSRLLAPLTERHRFVDPADRATFIERFATLAESCDAWELSLSPDLSDLTRLMAFLSAPSVAVRGEHAAGAAAAWAP